MELPPKALKFRFRWVRKSGDPSLFSTRALLDEDSITLGRQSLGYDQVVDSSVRDDRVILLVDSAAVSDKLRKKLICRSI